MTGQMNPTRKRRKRRFLLKRDGDVCQICFRRFRPNEPMTIDHIKPRRDGGSHVLDNLRLAHMKCNTSHIGEP